MYVHSQQGLLKEQRNSWTFTIDTEATAAGEKKTGIPLNLTDQSSIVVNVNWGDGTTSTLTAADYAIDDSRASVHEYETPGVYQVTMTSYHWNSLYLLSIYNSNVNNLDITSVTNMNSSLYWWRRTLTSVDSPIPRMGGIYSYYSQSQIGYSSNKPTTNKASFHALFAYCRKLTSISEKLFINNNAAKYFNLCFSDCNSLQSIPANLFDNNTLAYSFFYCFRNCSSLASIPSEIFDKNTAVTDFISCFQSCSSLQSIPSGLFDKNTAVTSFKNCFSGCRSITSIPSGLFDKNTAVTSFLSCFNGCSSLQSIPSGLFDKNTAVTNFGACFSSCSMLQSISSGLFDKNTAVTSFYACFQYCSSLTSISSGLFDKNTAVTSFESCFSNCTSLRSIPSGLFDNNTAVTSFYTCFSYCTSLQSIPSGLFDKNTAVTDFTGCFGQCCSLLTIPSDLFKYNINVTEICMSADNSDGHLFAGCKSLTSIPEHLFDSLTKVQQFKRCFSGCSSLQSIPSGLFNNNTAATSFYGCFSNCTSLRSIPSGLFDNCTSVTSFAYCFQNCSSLQSIPSGLFDNNTAVTAFSQCFYGCSALKNFKLIIGSSLVSNFSSFVANTSNVTRIVCVPENSTTYTTLSSYAQTGSNKNNITVSIHIIDCLQTLEYTIDTEATTSGAKNATIPVSALQNASSKLLIDWGDGNGIELTPENVTTANLTHTYSTVGEYQITVGAVNWLEYEFLTDSSASSSNILIQTFRETVTSIDGPMPSVSNSTLDYFLYSCTHLASYSSRIFDNLPNATSAVSTFEECSSLAVISAGTLRNQTQLTNATSMFEGCNLVTYIPSGLISQCRQLTNATQMFKNCTSLTYYPNTLLLNNTALTTRTNMFAGCSNTNPTFYTKAQLESNGYYVELFDTEAYEENRDKIGIPVNLAGNSETLTVAWGDSSTSVLSSSNYTEADSTASIHTYANLGLYFVSMQSTNWANTTLCQLIHFSVYESASNFNNATLPTFYRQTTLIEAPVKIPFYKEKKQYGTFNATSFSTTFAGAQYMGKTVYHYLNCKKLKFVCSNLFDDFTLEISFYECFRGCSSLQSIPSGLFDKNTAVTTFSECFYNCTSLESIPSELFDKNTAATTFASCFYNCSSLTSIPSGLFDKNTAVANFSYCFGNCTSLQSIPSGLFDSNTAVTSFEGCFSVCSSLTSIPSGLFDSNTTATTFKSCFSQCRNLTFIPSRLFDNNTAATSFYYCFNYCTSLTSIPSGLFDNNIAVTSFASCFTNCSSLQSIPSGLFDNNTAVTNFNECFYNCTSLTSIPSGLFDSNTAVTTFSYCFAGCTSLTSIPSGLFDNNTAATTFQSCFSTCSSITSIPSGLFDNNVAATTFYYCFNNCSKLASIPSGLFDKNTAVTTFSNCFYYCSALNDFTITIGSSLVSSASSFVTKKTGTTRTLYVPESSTTYTTFNNLASTLGLTISTLISLAKLIEEIYPQSGFDASTDSMGMEINQGSGFIIAGTGENNVFISLSQSNYISKLVDGIEYLLGTFNVSDLTNSGKTTFGLYLAEDHYGYGSGYEYYTPIDEHTLESNISFNVNELITNKNVSYTLENICLDDHDGWVFGNTNGNSPESGLGNVIVRVALSQNNTVGCIYAKWISPSSLYGN